MVFPKNKRGLHAPMCVYCEGPQEEFKLSCNKVAYFSSDRQTILNRALKNECGTRLIFSPEVSGARAAGELLLTQTSKNGRKTSNVVLSEKLRDANANNIPPH